MKIKDKSVSRLGTIIDSFQVPRTGKVNKRLQMQRENWNETKPAFPAADLVLIAKHSSSGAALLIISIADISFMKRVSNLVQCACLFNPTTGSRLKGSRCDE